MLEIEKLRKADIFSGTAILLLGLFIISQALQMPMTDSYAGVQNVWYVSPALFPLLVGSMLALLGLLLIKTAFNAVGAAGMKSVFSYLTSSSFVTFLKSPATIRYYGIVLNLLVFVFLLIPRIDFFLAAILFLLVFFLMFYCGSDATLVRLIYQVIGGTLLLGGFMVSGLSRKIDTIVPFSADILALLLIAVLVLHYFRQLKPDPLLLKKYWLSLLIAFVAPFTIGIIFKYFLLVPMPAEGLVVSLLDTIWYADFWS
jgi:hypothetical protein